MAEARAPALELDGVVRICGATRAVDGVSLAIAKGTLHALVGENGAGKSSALKIAAGHVVPDRGRVRVGGAELAPHTAREAIARGVGLVHQHFMLVDAMTALENLMLGNEGRGPVLDRKAARAKAAALMKQTGLEVDLDARAEALGVGEKQRLEILRVLYRGASVLLLDEPTAVLTPQLATELYETLTRLVRDGATVAVVTHRLDEVERWADRVTVLRQGKITLEADRGFARGDLVRAIMGGELAAPEPRGDAPVEAEGAEAALELVNVTVPRDRGQGPPALDVSLRVAAGEVLGVAGVEGNGQRELVRAIAGLEPRATGELRLFGASLPASGDVRARPAGLAVVHEDRHVEGLVLDATVGDNFVLGELGAFASREAERAEAAARTTRFDVRPADAGLAARSLSGGNQQKIVVGRAVAKLEKAGAGALVVAQPTRGVDLGAAAALHAMVLAAAAKGSGVVVVSADLAELRKLAHRIVVLYRGRVAATFEPSATDDELGRAMLGGGA